MPDPASPDSSSPGTIEDRVALGGRTLREHAARGTIINAAFTVGLAGLGLVRNLLIAAFLTASEFGLWGLVYVSLSALLFLLGIGVSDKFVQQAERDQEAAFQKAFTINLVWRAAFTFLAMATLPGFALIYGRTDILLPGIVLSLAIAGSGLQSPMWIFYRQMRYGRHRALQSIEPVTSLVVTAALGIAGAGVWSLVVGGVVGHWAAGLAALKVCPYRLRLRFDRRMFGEYFSFSWPLVLAAGSGALMTQAAVIVGEGAVGLAGVGAIGLAATISRFAERADQIVTQTLYPAVCAVRDRRDLLFESFVKSNRLALMWGMPFGLGLALFAPDLVDLVLGEKWEIATELLQIFGVLAAVAQIAFNWSAYFLATGNTRPLAVNGGLMLLTFLLVGIPLMLAEGLIGYGIGMAAVMLVDLSVRAYYLTRLFSGFEMLTHAARAMAPSVPAVAAVLCVRLLAGGDRPVEQVVGELVLYAVVTAAATWLTERELVREMLGYLRGAVKAPQPA
ncbi:MAG TPA: oligosaccharide flippase family protein [Thermoleophilaceae bacterium]|jgi:O-antigen/teichoic acid export membrane protein